MSNCEEIDIEYDKIIRETDKAYLFLVSDSEVWLPKSQISCLDDDPEDGGTFVIPRWLAEKADLV